MKYFPVWLPLKHFPVWLLLLLLGTFASCSTSKKVSAPAAISVIAPPDTLPPLPASEMDVLLNIAGLPLLVSADAQVPHEFLSDKWPAYLQTSCDFRYKYRFVRSGFTVHCANNRLSVEMQGNYQVAGSRCLCALNKPVSPWISGNCGFDKEPMRRVDIFFSTQLAFLPDYRIRTLSRPDSLRALDRCTMSVFSMDMTQQILDSIRSSINAVCATLDRSVAGSNFTATVKQAAVRAWQRTPIGPYGYLTINPADVRIGTLDYTRDTFHISLGLSCRPELGSDSSNRFSAIPALPPLRSGNNRGGVNLYLAVQYDYTFLNKVMNDSLRDKSFLVEGNAIQIKGVAVKGIDHHRLEIAIDFGGSRSGRIYIRGRPVLDTARQTLTIPDIDYSLESKDFMIKLARAFFGKRIKQSLRGNSYLDLGALLRTNAPVLDAQLNRQLAPNLRSTGHVKQLKLIGLLAGPTSVQAQIFVNADLAVNGTGLPK
jgi:Domain of unknown function (DUF4403)